MMLRIHYRPDADPTHPHVLTLEDDFNVLQAAFFAEWVECLEAMIHLSEEINAIMSMDTRLLLIEEIPDEHRTYH